MISQTLLDKLLELRLTAFREGLREQSSNPQYADLSFEERLLLLVDLECTHRSGSRIKRRLKLADFPMSATIEDLDFSPERGLDRRTILELAQSIARIIGWEGTFTFDKSKPDCMPRKVMDVSRLSALGWHAPTDFETGMKEAYRWYVANVAERSA